MIYFGYGVMGAAKTMNALKIVYDYETRAKLVLLLSNSELVESRLGLKHEAICFHNLTIEKLNQLLNENEYSAIIIDEVQFCPMDILQRVLQLETKYPIYCYGLYMNSNGTAPFDQSQYVMDHAKIKQEFYSVCEYCNQLAERHVALDDYNRIILNAKDVIRPKSAYKSICNKCFQKMPKIDYKNKSEP